MMGSIIPTRYPAQNLRPAIGSTIEPPQIAGPTDTPKHEDTSIILLLLEKYPIPFYGTCITMVVLLVTVIWQCGRQWDQTPRQESFEIVNPGESRSAQTSKQSNRGSFGWMNRKIEV